MDAAAIAKTGAATKITVGVPIEEDVPALIALVNALAAERSLLSLCPSIL